MGYFPEEEGVHSCDEVRKRLHKTALAVLPMCLKLMDQQYDDVLDFEELSKLATFNAVAIAINLESSIEDAIYKYSEISKGE